MKQATVSHQRRT